MSSVVNKSGTRFTPKLIQRRPVSATSNFVIKPSISTPSLSLPDKSVNTSQEKNNAEVERDIDISPLDNNDVNKQSVSELELFQDSTQSPQVALKSVQKRRRSSRLDSLSHAPTVFKTGFLSSQNVSSSQLSAQQHSRRSSEVFNSVVDKKRLGNIINKDTQFQEIKKRRMSSRSTTSRKSGSAQRISIVSSITYSDKFVGSGMEALLKSESEVEFFQRTDDLFKQKTTISTLKELPRNLAHEESSRYMIDEDNFTMADLCKPLLPIGEVSDNFHRAQDAAKAKLDARKKRSELRKLAKERFKSLNELTTEENEKIKMERKRAVDEILNADIPDENSHQTIQLKLTADGKMAVDEESTVVDRHRNAFYENAQKQRLDDNPFENQYNSSTYGRQRYTEPWSTEESIKFYKALSMWGTDFNLIAQLFPYRTRRQIKAKFVNEEKKHPVIIELALRSKLPPSFEQYCSEVQKPIGTVDEFNDKLNQLKFEHEKHLKQIELEKQNAFEQDLQQQNFKEKEHVDSSRRYSNTSRNEKLKTYRKSEIVLGTIDSLKRKEI